jgi:hypothetical protein
MTLEEAIWGYKHCKTEHAKQIATWLEELKFLRDIRQRELEFQCRIAEEEFRFSNEHLDEELNSDTINKMWNQPGDNDKFFKDLTGDVTPV